MSEVYIHLGWSQLNLFFNHSTNFLLTNYSFGGVPVDVYQVPLFDIMGKSKEISPDLRKQIVDLHQSGSSLGAISKRLISKRPRRDHVHLNKQ